MDAAGLHFFNRLVPEISKKIFLIICSDEKTQIQIHGDYPEGRGLYIGKYPPGGGRISQCHLGEKILKGREKKAEFEEEQGRKGKEKGRKGKENKKRGSKRVK